MRRNADARGRDENARVEAVIPNKSLAESNKSDSPVPSYSGGRLLLIAFGAA